jgi:hypothetical protein
MAKNQDEYRAREAQRQADQAKHDAANRMWQQRANEKASYQAQERKKTNEAWKASGGGCFPKGTQILTPNGTRDIATLSRGELVVTINPKENKEEVRRILKTISHSNRRIWQLEFSDGSVIRTTSVHSFFIAGKWKKASQIKIGEAVILSGKSKPDCVKTVVTSKPTTESEDVYNLIIDRDFNFLVEGVVAHSFTYFKRTKMWVWLIVVLLESFLHCHEDVMPFTESHSNNSL